MSKELDYIAELERENRLLGERCNQLLKDKGELTDKIADIKANYDLAIEGRDIKIKELEKEIEKHKWNNIFLEDCAGYDKKIAEEYTTLQERNKELEQENAELQEQLKSYNGCGDWDNDFHTCRVYLQHEELQMYINQLTKAKDLIKNIIRITWGEGWNYSLDWKAKAEQFLKEIEKCQSQKKH